MSYLAPYISPTHNSMYRRPEFVCRFHREFSHFIQFDTAVDSFSNLSTSVLILYYCWFRILDVIILCIFCMMFFAIHYLLPSLLHIPNPGPLLTFVYIFRIPYLSIPPHLRKMQNVCSFLIVWLFNIFLSSTILFSVFLFQSFINFTLVSSILLVY